MLERRGLAAAPAAMLLVLLAAPLPADDSDSDGDSDFNAGSVHAKLLRRACFADRRDDLLVHLADCIYVTSEEDEDECRTEAAAEAADKAEECREVYRARRDVCDLVGEERFDIEFEPAEFVDPDEIGNGVDPNPYWPLTAGDHRLGRGGQTGRLASRERSAARVVSSLD